LLDGLGVLLDAEPDMDVVARVTDGPAAIRASTDLAPDVVVMDLRMPVVDGIAATRQILAALPNTRVIALSADGHRRAVDGMVRAGACGYITKQRAYTELVLAIRTVMQGKIYLSSEAAAMVASGSVSAPSPPKGASPLSIDSFDRQSTP
jgi:LuxR family transcriptional regulator, maltose regulon positive regulatory protein